MMYLQIVILYLLMSSPGLAYTCEDVKAFVSQHGARQALVLAKQHGITLAQIMQARACLKVVKQKKQEQEAW